MLKIVGTALFAAGLIAGAAQAQPDLVRKDVEVSYSDLDLSTDTGARALLGRIDAAAKSACGETPYFYSYYSVAPDLASKDFATCRANAMTVAVTNVKAPLVHQLFANSDHYVRVARGN
jgi:UrcA family protein